MARRSSLLAWAALALVLAFGLAVRSARLPTDSILGSLVPEPVRFMHPAAPPSMDELWHLALTTGRGSPFAIHPRNELIVDMPGLSLDGAPPWWRVWVGLDDVTHPPLYLVTLRLWREVAGDSVESAISYSVLWSMVFLAGVFLTARRLFGLTAALFAGLIAALAPTQVYFGLEIRGYAMLTALASLLLYVVIRIRDDGATRTNTIALSVLLLAAILTHYHAAGVCVAAGAMALGYARVGQRRRVAAAIMVATLLVCTLWLPFAFEQWRLIRRGTEFLDRAGPITGLLESAIQTPLQLISDVGRPRWPVLTNAGLLALACVLAVRSAALRPVVLWVVLGVGWLLLLDIAFDKSQVAMVRYSAAVGPAVMMLVPALCTTVRRRRRLVIAAGGVTTLIACLALDGPDERFDSANLHASADALARYVRPNEVIVIRGAERSDLPVVMALHLMTAPGVFPRDVMLIDRPLSGDLLTPLQGRHVWYLSIHEDQLDSTIDGTQTLRTASLPSLHMPTGRRQSHARLLLVSEPDDANR